MPSNQAQNECNILSQLKHPNIVRYVDFDINSREAVLFMEACFGTLRDYMALYGYGLGIDGVIISNSTLSSSPSERIPEAIIWNIISQLASALLLCHDGKYTDWDDDQSQQGAWKAVIHRDIKPSNSKAIFFKF